MIWHTEEVFGIDAAIAVLNRLLPMVEEHPFSCVGLEFAEGTRLLVFQKPWPATSYVLFGNLSVPQIDQLIRGVERFGLRVFDNTAHPSDRKGLSFFASNEGADVVEMCRQFSKTLLGNVDKHCSRIIVLGISCSVEGFLGG